MDHLKLSNVSIAFWMIPIALLLLGIEGIVDQPRGYYDLLRAIIFIVSGIICLLSVIEKKSMSFSTTIFLFLAIIYNPFHPFFSRYEEDLWVGINIITIIALTINCIAYKKNHQIRAKL